jgi:tetratricopeptide (TPR) repeat protein
MASPNNSRKNSKYSSVFLSYSRKDKEFVSNLVEKLREKGVDVWLDEDKLELGEWFTKKIGEAIDKSKFFAVVLSKNALDSKYVEKEIEIALNREIKEGGVIVLPLLIEENLDLSPFLRGKNYVLFTSSEDFEKSFQKLLKALEKTEEEPPISDKFYPNNFIPELEYFVGRTKLLKDLKKQLKITHRASIHDISGLGKTFTTYKFADENQDDYEKIFFIRANKEEMMQSLAEIGVLLNPSLRDEQDQSKQAQGFKNWLEKNDKWLVIYYNFDVPVELDAFIPLNKKGDCIFTSNFVSVKNLGKEIVINKLDKDDAQSLLFSRVINQPHSKIEFSFIEEQKAFENIVKEIDGLPGSLNTTGAYISENIISFAEFERIMQQTPIDWLEYVDEFDGYKNKSALKAFSIAIDDISVKKPKDKFENSAELAQKLLFAASFIAPDNIYENLLQKILQEISEIDFESAENELLWLEIRRKLFAYDLLKYDIPAKLFTTHRLIQKVTQTKLKLEEKEASCTQLAEIFLDLFPKYDYLNKEICEKYYQHVLTFLENTDKLQFETENTNNLYYRIGLYQKLLGNYAQAELFYRRALEISAKAFGKEHSNYAICLNNLALVYRLQGKYDEAIELYRQAKDIFEKTLGKEHPDNAVHLNNLANVYQLQGKYDEAIELYKQALGIGKKTIGKEHPNYAIRLNNLASVYQSQGKYDKAIEIYKNAKNITEKTLGKEHPDYAIRLSNLANVYEKQGKYKEALDLVEEALRIDEKTLSENHPYTLQDRRSVARYREKLEKK